MTCYGLFQESFVSIKHIRCIRSKCQAAFGEGQRDLESDFSTAANNGVQFFFARGPGVEICGSPGPL